MSFWREVFSSATGHGLAAKLLGEVSEDARHIGVDFLKKRLEKFTENHRELFFRMYANMRDSEYRKVISDRLQEAKRVKRENWMVEHIGKLVESAPEDQKEFLFNVFAVFEHDVAAILHDDEKLREEWKNPQKSEFVQALHTLDDDRAPEFIRYMLAGARALWKHSKEDAKVILHDAFMKYDAWDEKFAPRVKQARKQLNQKLRKGGYL